MNRAVRLVSRFHDNWQSCSRPNQADPLTVREIAELEDRVDALRNNDRRLAHVGLSRFVGLGSSFEHERGVRGLCVATEV